MAGKTYNIWVRLADGVLARSYYGPIEDIPPTDNPELYGYWWSADDKSTYDSAIAFYGEHNQDAVYTISETGALSWALRK